MNRSHEIARYRRRHTPCAVVGQVANLPTFRQVGNLPHGSRCVPAMILLSIVLTAASLALADESSHLDSPPKPLPPGPTVLDDAPLPLVQQQPRSDEEQERVDALALFAAG